MLHSEENTDTKISKFLREKKLHIPLMTFSEIHKQLLQQLTKNLQTFWKHTSWRFTSFRRFQTRQCRKQNRQSVAGYVDFALNITDWFLADAAARYENYSDFGSTFNYKLASRIKVADNFNLRFAGSTGFRAPSIHQIYYNVTSTLFTSGQLWK
jgi:outer membrane cobalamin receptor